MFRLMTWQEEDLMDFNAMAALLHLLLQPDRPPVLPRYVFYLHDTVQVGRWNV